MKKLNKLLEDVSFKSEGIYFVDWSGTEVIVTQQDGKDDLYFIKIKGNESEDFSELDRGLTDKQIRMFLESLFGEDEDN